MTKSLENTPTPMLNQIETELVSLEKKLDALSEILKSATRLDDRTNAQIRKIEAQTLSLQSRLEPFLGSNTKSEMATTLYTRVNQLLYRCGEHLGSETVSAGFEFSSREEGSHGRLLYVDQVINEARTLVMELGGYFFELVGFQIDESDGAIQDICDMLEAIEEEIYSLRTSGVDDYEHNKREVALIQLQEIAQHYLDFYIKLREAGDDLWFLANHKRDRYGGPGSITTDAEEEGDDEEDNPIDFV